MELPGFRELEYLAGTKEHTQLRTPERKQARHAGRWLAILFNNSFSLQIKSFLQYFCVVFITKSLP